MSIWSDMEDRSAGEMRREDLQRTINDLLEENRQLQEANRKLVEQLDWYRKSKQFADYFNVPNYVVWPDKAEDEDVSSIFKF